jgi:hypothetical protein
MTDEPRPDVDQRLRDAFAPDAAAVRRVAASAGTRARPAPQGRFSVLATRAAALCVTGGAAVVLVMIVLQRQMPPPVAAPEPAPVSISGSFTNGLLVVPLPDGSISITDGKARDNRPLDGYGLVLVQGELR